MSPLLLVILLFNRAVPSSAFFNSDFFSSPIVTPPPTSSPGDLPTPIDPAPSFPDFGFPSIDFGFNFPSSSPSDNTPGFSPSGFLSFLPSPDQSPLQCEDGGSVPPSFSNIFDSFDGGSSFFTPVGSPSSCSPPPPSPSIMSPPPPMSPPPMSPPPPPPGGDDGDASNNHKVYPVPATIDPSVTGSVLSDSDIQALLKIKDECNTQSAPSQPDFITSSGTRFVKGGRTFNFIGFNAYQLVGDILYNRDGRGEDIVQELMANAARVGMSVGRLWAFSDEIRTGPVTWQDRVFEALDGVLEIASNNGISIVLGLTNYWQEYLSPELYVYWAYGSVAGRTVEDFYTDETVKLLYQAHVCKVLNRVNSRTGLRYKDDPTIMSWNLMNEPRCAGCSDSVINNWVGEMATFVKTIDTNHLVTIGMEGFHSINSAGSGDNPGSYGNCLGSDFVSAHSVAGIDYATAHYYPDQKGYDWENNRNCDLNCKFAWALQACQTHVSLAAAMNMPFVVEEFGVSVKRSYEDSETQSQISFTASDRVLFYKNILGEIVSSVGRGDAGVGAMFWTAALTNYPDYDGFTVYLDTTLIQPYSVGIPLTSAESDRFRRRSDEQACASQVVTDGWRPNTIAPNPVTPLGGSREVDVLFNAAAQI